MNSYEANWWPKMCPVNERCPTRDLKHVFSFAFKEVLCSSSFCFTQSTYPYEKVEKTKMPKFLIWWFLTIKLKRKLARKMLGFFLQVLLPSALRDWNRLLFSSTWSICQSENHHNICQAFDVYKNFKPSLEAHAFFLS